MSPCFSTPLHRAVSSSNNFVFTVLLTNATLNLEIQDTDCHTVLWLALTVVKPSDDYGNDSYAYRLVQRGSSAIAFNKDTGIS